MNDFEHMTIFEQVSSIVNSGRNAGDMRENCIYWCDGDKIATVNVNANSRYASRLRKLAESDPDDVKIYSDRDGGYLVATVPLKAVKLNIVHRDELSDEKREAVRQRMEAARKSIKHYKGIDS